MKAIQGQYIVSRLHTFICAADKRMLLNPFAVVQAKTSLDVDINFPLEGARKEICKDYSHTFF